MVRAGQIVRSSGSPRQMLVLLCVWCDHRWCRDTRRPIQGQGRLDVRRTTLNRPPAESHTSLETQIRTWRIVAGGSPTFTGLRVERKGKPRGLGEETSAATTSDEQCSDQPSATGGEAGAEREEKRREHVERMQLTHTWMDDALIRYQHTHTTLTPTDHTDRTTDTAIQPTNQPIHPLRLIHPSDPSTRSPSWAPRIRRRRSNRS